VTHTECCIHTPLTRTCMLSTLAAARTPTPQHRGQQQPSHQAELEEKKRQLQAIKERRERRTRERASKVRVCVVCLDLLLLLPVVTFPHLSLSHFCLHKSTAVTITARIYRLLRIHRPSAVHRVHAGVWKRRTRGCARSPQGV
jgi:hypothetical protein